jgi:hypothetical protein
MAVRNRPRAAKHAVRQQQARVRRGAPGKRFIGEAATQSAGARREERKKVERMAEVAAARRRVEEIPTPVAAILAELVQDAVRLARTLVAAPFRIARALARPRDA